MTNPLSNLVIDKWYKGLLVLGACVLMLSLTVELAGVNNNLVQCLSLGGVFIGLGEWINHPLQERIMGPFIVKGHSRRSGPLGNLFDILGFLIIVVGICRFR